MSRNFGNENGVIFLRVVSCRTIYIYLIGKHVENFFTLSTHVYEKNLLDECIALQSMEKNGNASWMQDVLIDQQTIDSLRLSASRYSPDMSIYLL